MKWLPPTGMTGRVLEYDFREGGRYRIELQYEEESGSRSGKTTNSSDITNGHFLELIPERCIKQSVNGIKRSGFCRNDDDDVDVRADTRGNVGDGRG